MGKSYFIHSLEFKESCSIHSDQYHLWIWWRHEIILDNGFHFKGEIEKLLQQFNIQHHKSSPYCPQTNGAVEAANKNIGRILKKGIKNYKDWHLQLPYALWGYRISIQSSTRATPYSLVYGMEIVLLLRWVSVC